jgi:hypothetical protein
VPADAGQHGRIAVQLGFEQGVDRLGHGVGTRCRLHPNPTVRAELFG